MGVIKIAICDDLDIITEELHSIITELLKRHEYEAECKTFLSAKDLLKEIEDFSVVFLDIEMPGMDGIEAGNVIIKRNPGCRIIMATALRDRFKETFKFRAYRYIEKPFDKESIEEALVSAMDGFPGEECLELYLSREKHRIRQKDIVMIRAYNGYSEFTVGKLVFRRNDSLDELEKILDKRIFARVERRYIVNIVFLKKIKNTVEINGNILQVSRRNRKEFDSRYITYDTRYRRVMENE